ncbi:MAG: EAL domain-containing protein [Pirellulales bacterium]
MIETDHNSNTGYWSLSGQVEDTGVVRQIPISTSPFVVGRRSGLALSLPCQSVSKIHAELRLAANNLLVRDLSSTNGTYVNGNRIRQESPVHSGDLVQFGNVIFQTIGGDYAPTPDTVTIETDVEDSALAFVQFDKLMSSRAVIPFFQPIVELSSRESNACEVLGRSRLFGVRTPEAMFQAATRRQQAAELSRLLRAVGSQAGADLPGHPNIYLNTHPSELQSAELVDSLRELRSDLPDLQMTLEIHEAAVTEIRLIRELRAMLGELEISLAYDDFGAGQSRLLELAVIVPDVLKFDMALIRGIDQAPAERHKVVESLVRMARELGATPLAEGIETESEARTCGQLGFELGQGFHLGRPVPAKQFAALVTPSPVPVA